MEKESKLVFGVYVLTLMVVAFSSFQSAYKVLAPFLVEGAGHKVGWLLAIKLIFLSTLVGIVALARLLVVIKKGGLMKVVPAVGHGKFLRYLSLIFIFTTIAYNFIAYLIAFSIPSGWAVLLINNLFPSLALALVLFEASRIYAFELGTISTDELVQKDP